MLTLDKVKLVATLDCLLDYEPDRFSKTMLRDKTEILKFKMTRAFTLSIEIKPAVNEFVVEFTGKILGKDYPQLISSGTILTCFDRINELGVCSVDPAAMMGAEVVKCDITKDVQIEDIPALGRYVRGAVRNYEAYTCTKFRNGNVAVEKSVTTHKRKKRITIYDKERQMNLHEEQPFVAGNGLDGKYDGICRFELNLTSKEQIRDALGLTGNTLAEVLRSDKSPIRDFLGDILAEDPTEQAVTDWKSFQKLAVLKMCDFDLEKVEAKIRQFKNPRNTSIPKMMVRFREILAGLPTDTPSWTKQKLIGALK